MESAIKAVGSQQLVDEVDSARSPTNKREKKTQTEIQKYQKLIDVF